jgi:hypothetical protein
MASGTCCSAIMANRHVHSRFRGATPSNWTLSGTHLSGRLAATSVIVSRHRPSRRSFSRSVIRAVAAGLTFASKTSSLAGHAAVHDSLIVDHRRPCPDRVQDAGARCPLPHTRADR